MRSPGSPVFSWERVIAACWSHLPHHGALFFAGLLLGLAAFYAKLALYVGQNEGNGAIGSGGALLPSPPSRTCCPGPSNCWLRAFSRAAVPQRNMFFAGFLGVMVGYPVGVVFLRFRPVRFGTRIVADLYMVLRFETCQQKLHRQCCWGLCREQGATMAPAAFSVRVLLG